MTKTNFSQMIIPMLRKLNDDQKHFAKIEIMNILQKAKSFCSFETPIRDQGSRSQVSFTLTPSPQSYYTHSPSPSPITNAGYTFSVTKGSISHVSLTPTSMPQSHHTYSPSPSPTMSIQSPVSTSVLATSSARKKPQIMHQEVISIKQTCALCTVYNRAYNTNYLPLISTPSTSQAPVNSFQELEQPQLVQVNEQEPTASYYLSHFQEQ